jgi:hypothetical protein
VPASVPVASAPDTAPTPWSVPANGSKDVQEFRGAYTSGFEMSWFEPCNVAPGEGMWWVTLTGEAVEQRDSLLKLIKASPRKGLVVRWRGTISPRMQAGHMGRGTRYMLVTEILDIRPLVGQSACPTGRAS